MTKKAPITSTTIRALLYALCFCLLNVGARLMAADWPQWGGTSGKNMASEEKGLPDLFTPGEKDVQTGTIKMDTTKNVLWARKACVKTFSTPVVAGGKVFLCGYGKNKGGMIACMDERTGRLLWQWQDAKEQSPSNLKVKPESFGICSTPLVDGNRLYVVDFDCEALCLDVNGEPDAAGGRKARVLWTCNMKQVFKTKPADTYCGSCMIDGEILYVPTSNGAMGGKLSSPNAPNVVALDKNTGRVLATDAAPIAKHLLKGQWSSISLGKVADRNLIFYGGGDGRCYAFESLTMAPEERVELKCAWSYDCIPADYTALGGESFWGR
ncbi:MAG: PQQ-binding-like beta-propeller repeat protein [Candidatus Sumerlaeota bacterium]|nr:PQQ-binding-like beta-propeller repeat protein [Candidatus Sumerlaeota bacterium]